ncbi:MAG: dihydroneopterin aldolase, partial [Brevundimonas sp.]
MATPAPADDRLRFERLSVFVRGLEVEAGIGVYD